jgi:putative ABC transport system substrate-binding protein
MAMSQLQMDEARQAARALGAAITFVNASTEKEIERAFDYFRQQHTDALLILNDSFLNIGGRRIAELALLQTLPTSLLRWAMSYGASRKDATRQSGVYAGRILKGEKPADLPVLQPAKFELVINVNTARAPGISGKKPADVCNAEFADIDAETLDVGSSRSATL